MKVDAKVIASLNQNLALNLVAINQYFLHARILNNRGFCEIGGKIYKRSIKMMKEADDVIERILLLEGMPNLQDLGTLSIGADMAEILACDSALEERRHVALQKAVAVCEEKEDFVSRAMLVSFKDSNEDYRDWLETQQDLIGELGLGNYLQSAAED